MGIKISDIPPEGVTLNLALDLDLFGRESTSTACSAILAINPLAGNTFHLAGRVKAMPVLECSRCLAQFSLAIDAEWEVDLAPIASAAGAAAERELVTGELDTEFYEGDELDTENLVQEQVLIAIPMVPLHRQDCKGLCSVCGADLNTTECGHQRNAPGEFSAFSALKDLLKK